MTPSEALFRQRQAGRRKVTSAMVATGMPYTNSRTIWARRQVTTDPVAQDAVCLKMTLESLRW